MLTHGCPHDTIPARVVVLGAKGFVGSASLQRLAAANVPALGLSRDEIDLASAQSSEQLASLLRRDDVLLVAAAKAPAKDRAAVLENLRMIDAVCGALARAPVAHVIYVGSDAVYADSEHRLTETSCAQPVSLHGVMHLAREIMLTDAWNGPLCLVRPSLLYGAGDPHNGYGPNRFWRQAAAGDDITLFGEGEERRDHVHIDDVADLLCRIVLRRSTGVLNIATGDVASFREVAETVVAALGSRSAVKGAPRHGPMPHRGFRPFDVSATHQAFPDFAYTPLRDGLRRM